MGKIDLSCIGGFASLVQGKKRSLRHIINLFFTKVVWSRLLEEWSEIKVNSATGFSPEAIAMQLGAFCSYPWGETFVLVSSLNPNDSTVTWKYTSGSVIFTWFPFLDERGQLSSLHCQQHTAESSSSYLGNQGLCLPFFYLLVVLATYFLHCTNIFYTTLIHIYAAIMKFS